MRLYLYHVPTNEPEATPEKPILVLDNHKKQWAHHSAGMFTNPIKRSTFEFQEEDGVVPADILKNGLPVL